jgi:FKBP-type peptidyl-prolyl cis-trans isomerase FkpA
MCNDPPAPAAEDPMLRWIRLTAIALPLAVAACAGSGGSGPRLRPLEATPFASALDVTLSRMTKTPSGLYYRDIDVGTGRAIRARDEVNVRYTGWLSNGEKFDGVKDDDPPIPVELGRGRAIAGWDRGLPGMRVGGKRQLVIPPELGYGSRSVGPVPADAVLVFVITVVSVK